MQENEKTEIETEDNPNADELAGDTGNDTEECKEKDFTDDTRGDSEKLTEDESDVEHSQDSDNATIVKTKSRVKLVDSAYNKLLPFSLLAALIGAIVGPVPLLAGIFISEKVFYPLFIIAPLLTHFINKLLKGGRDIRALIVNAVFSLVSTYTALLACQATIYLINNNLPLTQLPILIGLQLGGPDVMPELSTLIYPVIFAILGIAMSWELMRGSRMVKKTIVDEPDSEDEQAVADERSEEESPVEDQLADK